METVRDAAARRKAARHIAYELGMLRHSLTRMRSADSVDAVSLECFLIHTRNLIELFFDKAPRGTILPKAFGLPSARDKDPEIASLHDEVSQLVAHLAWDRVDHHELQEQDWGLTRLGKIFDRVGGKAALFFQSLTAEREWFTCDHFPDEWNHWMEGGPSLSN